MANLTEWKCPKTDHPPMWGESKGAGVGTTTTEAATVILLDPPPVRPWECFWCQTPLVRVRDISRRVFVSQ